MKKQLRILYVAGPGNIIGTYKHWKKRHDDPSQVHVTYSGQFFDICRELGAQAYVISSNKERGLIIDDQFMIEHRPVPFKNSRGLFYHLSRIWYGLRLIISAMCFRADVSIVWIDMHWFIFSLMPLFGIKVIPTLHNLLWSRCKPQTQLQRIIHKMNRGFFAKKSYAIISASKDISKQIKKMTNWRHRPITLFLPYYRKIFFSVIKKPNTKKIPFQVFFIGRIERNKGVFDLLTIAKHFKDEGRKNIEFDLCGSGSDLEEIHHEVNEANLTKQFRCHGHCSNEKVQRVLSESHVVIVPTRSDFSEGFNQVVIEGILAGRPVITSDACPALAHIRDAAIEVPPDDVKAYGDAILKLYSDHKFYEKKCKACLQLQSQFYDFENSWGNVLKKILLSILKDQILICLE